MALAAPCCVNSTGVDEMRTVSLRLPSTPELCKRHANSGGSVDAGKGLFYGNIFTEP